MEIDVLVRRYPRLYHMAERETWPSIKKHGLLSTSAVLDFHGITGSEREGFERKHRHEKVAVGANVPIVLRDQKPMAPDRLAQALQDGITPTEWYELLNAKVFMWAREERLLNLLNARHYRALEHDVLTVDTASLIAAHHKAIWLCPMNSGNTFPIPHRRGRGTFLRIADYPAKRSGQPEKEVAEVVVDYSVPDIDQHVVEVRRMLGDRVIEHLKV